MLGLVLVLVLVLPLPILPRLRVWISFVIAEPAAGRPRSRRRVGRSSRRLHGGDDAIPRDEEGRLAVRRTGARSTSEKEKVRRLVGGDFATTDLAAAAPNTYDHGTGGGAFNDRTIGVSNDVVESLEGGDFACGDIVTYFLQIVMDASPVDASQTAQFDLSFSADSTGQSGAAHADVVGVSINHGQVENGDDGNPPGGGLGVFGLDSGISDDGGSTVSIISETISNLFNSGNLLLTIEVDDLEASEKVVIRIDTLLACDPGSSPTGNLQGRLDAGRVVSPAADAISTGAQTIPFKQIGDIAGAGEPLLKVEKTVTTADWHLRY